MVDQALLRKTNFGLSGRLGAQPPEKVAVLRARGLAGLLTAVPALRALRSAIPNAEITLIGAPGQADFARRFGYYVDDFLEIPGYPGLIQGPKPGGRFLAFLAEAQARGFDLAIQMHGCGTIANPLVALLGAGRTAGYYLQGQYVPDRALYMLYPVTEPEIARDLCLMEFLGVAPAGEQLEFPIFMEEWSEFHRLQAQFNLAPFSYLCLELPPSDVETGVSPDLWVRIGRGVIERGMRLIVVGDREARAQAAQLSNLLGTGSLNLAGELAPGPLAALLTNSRMLVSMQGGASVLAMALHLPNLVMHREAGNPISEHTPSNRREIRWAEATPASAILAAMDDMLVSEPAGAQVDDPINQL